MDETYACAGCGGTFAKGWTDGEALAEFEYTFDDYAGPVEVVCDDCYRAMGLNPTVVVIDLG